MSESKGASRRPSKGKTIDLEAQELTPPQDAADAPPAEASPDVVSETDAAQAAAPEQPGEPVDAATDAPVRDELADAREESAAEAAASSGTAERAQEAAPAVVQKRGAGPLGLLTAAILGGIVAAGGLVGLNASGVVGEIPGLGATPQADPAALSSMESELAALRDKVAALESAPAAGASIDPARIDSL
ncbi:MAG: hypothetical protein MUE79_08845, partial [Nitratireductor sp.]|nr:hypothetical protein [Nitratireductor sp.]